MSDSESTTAATPDSAEKPAGDDVKGFSASFKQHKVGYLIGGGIVVIGGLLFMYYRAANSNTANINGGLPTTATGNSPMALDTSQLDANQQQIMSFENQNLGVLNQILNALQSPTPQPNGPPIPAGFNKQTLMPSAKNTSGMSNNFWIYTSQPGDTLASIDPTAWLTQQQSGALNSKGVLAWQTGVNPVDQYRNNDAIFKQIGFNPATPNAVLPTGTRISL